VCAFSGRGISTSLALASASDASGREYTDMSLIHRHWYDLIE
jgi:hypothetical protein